MHIRFGSFSAGLFVFVVAAPITGQVPDSLAPPLVYPIQDFSFWIGKWNVNLQVKQSDNSWQDTHTADAEVFPVLNGKAVLELWDETSIKGFSLRYRDPVRNAWVLWLNWPGANRSGAFSMEGHFVHNRGEFVSSFQNADGDDVIARYTFSDITPTTLRWDDAYSRDGGATWSHQWVMHFTRMANTPHLNASGGPAHTFADGGRCELPPFRAYESLAGPWSGRLDTGRRGPVAVTGYQILGGCAIMLFAGVRGLPETATRFAHLTWNTTKEQFEILTLASDSAAQARLLFGVGSENGFVFHDADDPAAAMYRVQIMFGENETVVWSEEIKTNDTWEVAWKATVERFVPGRG